MFRKKPRAAEDPGLALIDRYQAAIVQSHMDHVRGNRQTPAVIAQERASVESLAGRIGDAMRAEYRARNTPC